jgi:hypothetical protein
MIDQATWETLRAGVTASKTWFFRVIARSDKVKAEYFFFFGRHFNAEIDEQFENVSPSVCLLISEQINGGDNVKLFELEQGPISLRELLVMKNQIARKRWSNDTGSLVYDEGVSPVTVAQEFFSEMIFARLST